FILWFGLGNAASVALVFYAATFPIILNTWTGVRSINRIWIRAAETMGAGGGELFRKVVLPGSLPFVIAGLRQAFARSWIAVVGGEMIAATSWGLGWVIFDSKEFLRTDVMLSTLVLIGGRAVSGRGLDRGVVFQDFAQLFPWRTAQRNVEFGLEMKGVPREERAKTAQRFLGLVNLESFAGAYPHELSGGMQQRAAI